MSAPAMSSDLAEILKAVGSGSSGSSGTASGSGVVNLIKGLDLSSLGGMSGGISAASLAAVGSLFGPLGTAVGAAAGLIPGLDGFLANGFDFTCLGAQAYNNNDHKQFLARLQSKVSGVDQNSIDSVNELVNWLCVEIAISDAEISKFKSGCSKSMRGKYKEACQDALNKILAAFDYTETTVSGNYHAGSFSGVGYHLNAAKGVGVPADTFANMTPEKFETELKPQIEAYALQNGLDVQQTIQTAYSKLFPNGGIYGGGSIGGDGWEVNGSFGNQPTNWGGYAILAAAGFAVYKLLKK